MALRLWPQGSSWFANDEERKGTIRAGQAHGHDHPHDHALGQSLWGLPGCACWAF